MCSSRMLHMQPCAGIARRSSHTDASWRMAPHRGGTHEAERPPPPPLSPPLRNGAVQSKSTSFSTAYHALGIPAKAHHLCNPFHMSRSKQHAAQLQTPGRTSGPDRDLHHPRHIGRFTHRHMQTNISAAIVIEAAWPGRNDALAQRLPCKSAFARARSCQTGARPTGWLRQLRLHLSGLISSTV